MDPKLYYSADDIVELLTKAEALGFSLGEGSELDQLTIAELDRLVHTRQ